MLAGVLFLDSDARQYLWQMRIRGCDHHPAVPFQRVVCAFRPDCGPAADLARAQSADEPADQDCGCGSPGHGMHVRQLYLYVSVKY